MGQDFSSEYPSTWQNSDVKAWKRTALQSLKSYYLGYEGIQWHEYSEEERCLLTIKICFALHGPPTDANNNTEILENAYNASQKEAANKIKDKIIEVYNDSPARRLRVGILFICCKQEEKEFLLPIFRVYVGDNDGDMSKYVDTNCRVYKHWTDWKENNKLPMLKYCYPSKGFFTCRNSNTYKFDSEQDPDVDYGTSPACDFVARVARQCDVLSGITSIGSGGIAIAAMFTPIAPLVLTGSIIAGTTAAIYGTGRSTQRLIDKGTHDESLTDLESLTCWLSIILTPAHFVTAYTNGVLAAGAQNSGRIFSSTARTAATILNLTTLGLDSVMVVFGLANLVEKAEKDQLTPLDVLQFSMSLFFFGHTLMQPKTATGIIKAAQNEQITAYKNALSDPEAIEAFQNFVDKNRGSGSIKDTSKIVRTINKIEDPNGFFKGLGDRKATIGSRKGNTVIIEDHHNQTHRVNPNRVFFDASNKSIDLNALQNNLTKCFDQDFQDVELNGNRIFRDLPAHQMQRVKTVLGSTARNYNKKIVSTAYKIAENMDYHNVDDFLCVVELVATEVKGLKSQRLNAALDRLATTGQADFITSINNDLIRASEITRNANITFANELKSVYHYRKHGKDFPTRLQDKFEFYLTEVPQKLFRDAHLININREPNGATIKTYITPRGKFGILVELPNNNRCIATMYNNPEVLASFQQRLATMKSRAFDHVLIKDMAKGLATSIGFAAVEINVIIDGMPTVSLEYFARQQTDPEALQAIARILHTMTLENESQSDDDE